MWFFVDSSGFASYRCRLGRVFRPTLEKSSKVIALSDSWAAFISQYAPKANVLVVPNSVKLSVVSSPLSEEAGRILYLGIAAHGHADALAITLSICGEECLVDPGTFSYWNELKWRDYFRGTSAHNTVTIDAQNQSVSGGRFMWTRKARARIEQRPVSPEQFDFVGSHDGYMRLADPVRHTRSVRYDQSTTTLLVRDEIAGKANHEVEQFWHFAPDVRVELSGTSAVVTGERFSMLVDFSGKDLELALFEGSENPPLGWFSRTYEAKVGYHPQVILAGRRINDGMGKYLAEQTIKQMIAAGSYIKGARVNVLGLTFKENCADLRNSKVGDVINELKSYGVEVFVHDPFADPEEAMHEYGVRIFKWDELPRADAIVAAVSHQQFTTLAAEDLSKKLVKGGCFIDVKACFDAAELENAGIRVWRL
jgi:hypothetical protein